MKFFRVILHVLSLSVLQASCQSPGHKTTNNFSTHSAMNPEKSAPHPYYSRTATGKLELPDSVWEKVLSPELYEVARHAATERAFTGKYWDFEGLGNYYCAACGNHLFRSDSKFSSGCGWPSFFEAARKDAVVYKADYSYGMIREEVLCGRCNSHLGHIFDDGPRPTGKRFCMNSVSLDFEPEQKP